MSLSGDIHPIAVGVDDGWGLRAHRYLAQKARASEEAPRPALESARGVSGNITSAGSELKRRMLLRSPLLRCAKIRLP